MAQVVLDNQDIRRRKSSMVGRDNGTTDCCIHALLASQQKRALEEAAGQIAADNFGGPQRLNTIPEPKDNDKDKDETDKLEHREEGHSSAHPDHERLSKVIDRKQAASHERKDDTDEYGERRVTHSRMLTKKQLSDMAWGVREISKRLGSVKMRLKVQDVFLLTKAHDQSLIGNTREVAKWLLSPDRRVRYRVWVEDKLKDSKTFNTKGLIEDMEKEYKQKEISDNDDKGRPLQKRLRYWTNELCRTKPHTFDFVVTLGGDGTVLYASWLFQRIVPPVLSFALGSLGFLTKFDYDNFPETLTRAFRDGIRVSLRLRFEGTVMRAQNRRRKESADSTDTEEHEESAKRDLVEELVGEEQGDERTHKPDGTFEILNDIVVDRGPNPSKYFMLKYLTRLTILAMSAIEIFGDDEHFTSLQADGVCVATPTGSTAYNLAAGGSLCHPENPVILVSAICAHTLSFRPIILPDTIVLRIGVPYDARASSWASFDGRERVELQPGDYVTISASRYPFANVMQHGRRSEDWVNSISGKLGWNTRQKQKSFDD